jgi:LytS/YehU family sensor histidine kinase
MGWSAYVMAWVAGAEDEVLLSQEWRFTQDYLAFEQLRLGDRLSVNAKADDTARALTRRQ